MTLEEIYKIIDEADVVVGKKEEDFGYKLFCIANPADYSRERRRQDLIEQLEQGWVMSFYRANPEKMELIQLAKVDHIDKEKKIIKKKLDEMTDKELDNLFKKNCKYNSRGCENCPLILQIKDGLISCIYGFREAKRTYDFFKDKEFEIEVEE